jgi:hypothetical protein
VGTPPVQGLGADAKRLAAAAAYGDVLSQALSSDGDLLEILDEEPTEPHQVASEASSSQRAVLEPVSETAHPETRRRAPTRPELRSEALAATAAQPQAAAMELAGPEPAAPEPASTATPLRVPEPKPAPEPKLGVGANRSPSPVRVRMGLFSADRITNLLAGAAVGLLLTIVPAHKFALSHAKTLLTQPLLELNDSIDHPLAVDAGLLRKPQAIAAEIEVSREAVRSRYFSIWLMAGLPLGLGLGLVPRFWA